MTDLVLINSPLQRYERANKPYYFTTAPIGLGYLATVARKLGYQAEIVDAEAEKLSPDEIVERVSATNPKRVGINIFSTNHQLSLGILDQIEAPVKLVGGPQATLQPERVKGDYTVVTGEAEEALPNLLRDNPKGIVHGGIVHDLDRLPFVDRGLFSNDPYSTKGGKEASMSTARGCRFSCAYCSVPTINGRKMRARSVDNVLDEIEVLQQGGVRRIHFIDDLFNYSKDRVREFAEGLQRREVRVGWRALCRTDNLDEKLLEEMKAAGCYKLAFGVESATSRILKYIGKSQDTDHTKAVFRKCKELGIESKGFFTIGYPTETKDEIEETIRFALDLEASDARFMVVRAFPETRLYADMLAKGFTHEQLDTYHQFETGGEHVKYHVMNIHSLNGMPMEELDEYVRKAYERFNLQQKGVAK